MNGYSQEQQRVMRAELNRVRLLRRIARELRRMQKAVSR